MKKYMLGLLLLLAMASSSAQIFPSSSYLGGRFRGAASPIQVPGPTRLEDYVVEGKLRLSLEDAVLLMLANNSDIGVDRAQFDLARFSLPRAHQPFDPVLTAGFAPTRSVSPSASSLVGAATLSFLSQVSSVNFSEQFQTGGTLGLGLATTRFSTNSTFATVNPSFTSGLTFSLAQPLWRNGGLFVNRAPILIAQRGVRQSRAVFAAQVNDAIQRAINQYWDVVQSRKNLDVLQQSLDLAQATYKRDKRALELGALSPLDIYRSESHVAQSKIAAIQAEYALKQAEDALRQTMGADLEARIGALDLDLTEKAEAAGALAPADLQEALEQALENRPEIDIQRQQLAIDDANVRLAGNGLKPQLDLNASYTSNGLGGVALVTGANGAPAAVPGGFTDSLSQVGGFGSPTYGMGLQLRLPIRDSAAGASLGTALVAKKRDLYQERSLKQSIGTQVKNAVHDLEVAELVVTAAQTSRDLAAKTLAADERKYQLGAETIFFVLDSQNQLSAAELALVQARIAYRRALAEVDHATGTLMEKYKIAISSSALSPPLPPHPARGN